VKVVVTGAAGFVGAQIVRALVRTGDEVHAVVRPTSNRRRLGGVDGARLVEADFLSADGREKIAAVEAETCIHAAWYAEPGKYLSAMLNFELLGATLQLARVLGEKGCRRFVGIGTCFEYDTDLGYLSEKTPLAPVHLYSAAKAGAYLGLMQLGTLIPMQVAWARLFYLYGPDEHPARLVPSALCALLRGEEARCTPGLQIRDFLHVEDAGSALCAVAHSDLVGAVNVASGQPVSVGAVVQQLGVATGRPHLVRLGALPYAPKDPMFVCADVRRLRSATDWRPRWSLADGMVDAANWWARHLAASVS